MRKLMATIAAAMILATPAMAQNTANNAGIWWGGPVGGPSAFTFLNPLTTVYSRIGVIGSWRDDTNARSAIGTPLVYGSESSWGGALGIGFRLMPAVRYELQASGLLNSNAGVTIFGIPVGTLRISSAQIMNNFYLDAAPLFAGGLGRFNIYAMAGLGVSINHTGDLVLTGQPPQIGSAATRTAFAWNVGLGGQYQLMNNLILDLGYRYLDNGGTRNNTSLNASAIRSSRMQNHQIMFSLVLPIDGLIRGY